MEDVPYDTSTVDIRVVGRVPRTPPALRVLIDGKDFGLLILRREHSFPVAPGVHMVRVKWNSLRSETLEVPVSPGEHAKLDCGVRMSELARLGAINASHFIMLIPLFLFNMPLLAMAIVVLWVVFMGFVGSRTYLRPGSHVTLRPRPLSPDPGPWPSPARYLPRMTIGRCMIAVAVVAILFAVGVQEEALNRRNSYQNQSSSHRMEADFNARQESSSNDFERRYAKTEELMIEDIKALSNELVTNPKDDTLREKIEALKRSLAETQARRAKHAEKAAYHAGLKQKYLRAAERPWEPLEPDPAPPVP